MAVDIDRAISFLGSWLQYRSENTEIPGFSVAVLVKDRTIFSRAYGYADVESSTLLTPDHLFHMASQTKMLTAVSILQLVQAERLGLDDKIVAHVPWLKKHPDIRVQTITVRHLLSHSSGLLRDSNNADLWLFKHAGPSKQRLQEVVLSTMLSFDPGSSIKYSNIGYGLLGIIIEAVTGIPVVRYFQRSIVAPLKLAPVYMDYSENFKQRVTAAYGLPIRLQRPKMTTRRQVKALIPATGMYSTPEVMCRFTAALFDGDTVLLNEALKKEMRLEQSSMNEGYDTGLAFGLGHEMQIVAGRRLFGHTGHVAGHVSATFYDPVSKVAVSVAVNARGAASTEIVRGIFGVFDFFLRPAVLNDAPSTFSVRLRNAMATIEIVQHGERIVAIDPDDWEPFSWYETLERIDDRTLRVITSGSAYNYDEKVLYNFDGPAIKSVRFAGVSLWPEKEKDN